MNKLRGAIALAVIIFTLLILPQISLASAVSDATDLMQDTFSDSLGTSKDLPEVIGDIVKVLLGFLGILAVLLILYGGFIWMTAAGDDGKVDKAKKIIYAAVIGLVIIFSAYAIASFVFEQISEATGAR
ncbi:MAG TPA: pilin [bacterium]|nr:pilin [bacterium]HPN81569.1 pilin [bacterium]HPW39552.1 pilin [bacterium]